MQEAGRTGRAAVIGLGSMGLGMALSLRRAGFEVAGCDLSAAAVERLVAAGGTGAATPAEAAAGADIVVSVVVNAAQTESVLFGEAGCAAAMPEGAVFVSSATMAPDAARAWPSGWRRPAGTISTRRSAAAPQRAAEGALTILASGSAAAFAAARPALDAMAAKLYELGDAPGTGAAFKMVNQLLAGVHIAAACEAIAFAARQGLDIAQGLRGDHRLGRQFLDVREPHPACAGRRLCAAQRGRHLHQGSRHRHGHGAQRRSSRCRWPARRCRCS